MRRAVPVGIGHYLPARVVENAEFETWIDTSDEWIRARTGIERRHFAAEGETTSHMAIRAAEAAIADAARMQEPAAARVPEVVAEAAGAARGRTILAEGPPRPANPSPPAIDAVIVATSTPDLTFPSVATMVQHGLGLRAGFAFDLQAVCAGFIYALSTANAYIVSGQADRVLVIGAETFSRIMDWSDRGTSVLFGDGAGAILFEAQDGEGTGADRGILSVDLHSDGAFKDLLFVDGGVSSTGTSGHLRMQGREVFRHAVDKLSQTAETALNRAGLGPGDVDWIVPHQANLRIITKTAQKMGVPMDRVIVTVQDHGNTSAASIPLALGTGVARGQIARGDLLVAEAIGGGLAWGSVVLRW